MRRVRAKLPLEERRCRNDMRQRNVVTNPKSEQRPRRHPTGKVNQRPISIKAIAVARGATSIVSVFVSDQDNGQ
jgi:hypothetical protein